MSGKLFAFWSPCSGSGVTTLCAKVGIRLAASAPTIAADLNLAEPSLAAVHHDGSLDTTLDSLVPLLRGRRASAEDLALHTVPMSGSQQFALLPGTLHPLAALDVNEGDIHRLLDLLLQQYQYVLADLGTTLDSVGTWPVLERADRVIWVVGGHYAARYHTRRYLHVHSQLNLGPDRALLVLNCTEPVTERQVRDELGADLAITIPHAPKRGASFDSAIHRLAGLLAPEYAGMQAERSPRWMVQRRGARAER